MNRSSIGVLVDRNVEFRRFITEPAKQTKPITCGPIKQSVEIVGWRFKQPLSDEHAWLNDEIACLPTIGRLAREGRLSLFTSVELQFEGWTARRSLPYGNCGDLFEGIDIRKLPDAVTRSYFENTIDLNEMLARETLQRFCARLIKFDVDALRKSPLWERLPVQTQRNLDDLERFRFLCRKVGKKHYCDAFHFWTAETHGLRYFLTLDKVFLNIAANQRGFVIATRPVSPSAMLDELGISTRDPFPADLLEFHPAI